MGADEMTLRGNILALGRSRPRIGNTVWIAPEAVVIGNLTIGDNSSVWFNCVLRGETYAISGRNNHSCRSRALGLSTQVIERALARQPTSTKGTAMATFLRIAIVAAAVAIQQPSASAAEFPSRSITIV